MANAWGVSFGVTWGNSWGAGITPVPPTDTHDGASPDQYRRYRKRLKAITKAAEQFQQSKYVRETVQEKIVEIQAIDAEIKEAVLAEDDGIAAAQFYQAFKSELSASIDKLNKIIIKIEQDEEDDIHAILLLSGGI